MKMINYVFEPTIVPSLPVDKSHERFPVSRVFCLGRNYHWGDALNTKREVPVFFMKPATSVINAAGELAFPPLTEEFCHEIELVVAIGKGGFDISEEHALEHVWGYAAGMDLTRRDMQMAAKAAGHPWEPAKAFDGSAPITPIVPASRSGHPTQGAVWLHVNGAERQRSDLESQIWSVAEVISQLSRSVTLRAGDLIMTGTPPGVGALQPGDAISGGIVGIGQFEVVVGNRRNT
ncbi:fumarylacetoacetate hydrolase family protein [Azotobacter beijerinckii]|uniref:fumarylacetoacetate hydrolase family protein n=1 Tax=Azotobacter beijerinckii TaxID=170623 RepID=UPI002954A7D5|nr:fumarylacetoacetate hydrolase family protein [Azotobacter beijerinckii]MDV7210930.1 fumarylacetoacetate hydrolase family protein [Azotobacter beijerinckii]